MEQAITFSNMRVKCSFPYLHIEEVSFIHQLNSHASMELHVSVEEQVAKKLLSQSWLNETIQLVNREDNRVLFAGMIENVTICNIKQVWLVDLSIISLTKTFDIKQKRKSYQNTAQTYLQLVSTIAETYPASQFIAVDTLSSTLKTMVLQYDETDWQLIQRVAARNHTFLVADIADTRPKFWIGLKQGRRIEPPQARYVSGRNYQKAWNIQKNVPDRSMPNRVNHVVLSTIHNYELGDYLLDGQEKYYVTQKKCTLRNGQLEFDYTAVVRQGFDHWLMQKEANIGLTLEGTVIAISGTNVKVHLDIDKEQRKQEALWFPYLTEGSNITYYMPEIGSRVKVYFPQDNETHASVMTGIRGNTSSYQGEMGDPTTKILSNPQGKRISLAPNDLSFVSDDGVSITLTDGSNIAISSTSSINMHSSADVSFSSHQSISVTADSGITLQGKSTSSIVIAADIQLSSPDLLYSGGSGVKATHKALEGSGQPMRKKRVASTQAIQDLDKVAISQKAIGVIPIVSQLSATLNAMEQTASTAVNTIPFTATERIIVKEERPVDNTSLPQKQAFRAKLSLGTLPIEGGKITPHSAEPVGLTAIKVTANGNLGTQPNQKAVPQAAVLPDEASADRFTNNRMSQKRSLANAEISTETKPFTQVGIKTINLNQSVNTAAADPSSENRALRGTHATTKTSEPAISQIPQANQPHKSIVFNQSNQPSTPVAAASSSNKNDAAGHQSAATGKGNKGSGMGGGSSSGGSSGGGGFGVINKGASSAISPVAFISAQNRAMINNANRLVTNRLIKNMSVRHIPTASFTPIHGLKRGQTAADTSKPQVQEVASDRKALSGIQLQKRAKLKPIVARPLILGSKASTTIQNTIAVDAFRKVETTLGHNQRDA